jgi:hypothetical protein
MWVGLPLLKDEDCDDFDDAISEDIESDIGSDISGASIVTSEGLLTFPDADLLELEQGYNAQLFYACVGALPDGVYEDSPPENLLEQNYRRCLLGLTKNEHLDVVMVGEGFTNSVWDHASTLQYVSPSML